MNDPSPTLTPTEPEAVSRPVRRNPWPYVAVVAYVLLAVAVGWLWVRPAKVPPAAPDLTVALNARLTALEQRVATASPVPDLTTRVEALEQRSPPDLSTLRARISNLEQHPPGDTEPLSRRIDALERTLGRADRVARVQAAAMALNAGRPLGTIPNAPAALGRFATAAPPTEAALRLGFPAAAEAALDAARPVDTGQPFLDRVLARAENLVTVRQGEHVLVGDAAAGVLTKARMALDAGDLDGTIAALAGLQGGAAQAMSHWLADATALRDARAALADMAAQP
jgi:hypothetical protein